MRPSPTRRYVGHRDANRDHSVLRVCGRDVELDHDDRLITEDPRIVRWSDPMHSAGLRDRTRSGAQLDVVEGQRSSAPIVRSEARTRPPGAAVEMMLDVRFVSGLPQRLVPATPQHHRRVRYLDW